MTTILGVVGLLAFIVCVIALASSVTWLVVKLTPRREQTPQRTPSS